MTGKKWASKIRTKNNAHTDLISDINSYRKCRRKDGKWEKGRDTEMKDKNKVDNIRRDVSKGCYDCQTCGKQFSRKNSLKLHQVHHNPKVKKDKHQCIGCNEGFKSKNNKDKHELKCERHERQSGLECSFCDLPCDTPKDLRMHENKHKPNKKTKNNKNISVCIESKKDFKSISSLKAHIKKDRNTDIKPEPHTNEETTNINEESTPKHLDTTLLDVSNLTKQSQPNRESPDNNSRKKPSSIQSPQNCNTVGQIKDKSFICVQCGSRYKYEKSKIKHELKYHGTPTERSEKWENLQQCREVNRSQQIKTSQVSNQNESINIVSNIKAEKEEKRENVVDSDNNDNNNIIPVYKIKEESCSLPVVEVTIHDMPVPGKQTSGRSHAIRNPIIKKKCIGCDKIFDGPKGRDEHELECGLNPFNRAFRCIFCDHPFSKPKSLRKHENKHRPARKTKKYKNRCVCIECNKTFDAIYSLRVHMKKLHQKSHVSPFENKPFACGTCDSRFKYQNSKFKHEMRYHSADVNFKVGYNNGASGFANLTDEIPVVCKLENCDLEGEKHVIKEEPDDNLDCEDNYGYITENKVVNPMYDIKTEVATVGDTPVRDPSVVGDATGVDEQETKASFPRRKRKGKQPVGKKPKKQKTGPFVCNNCEAKFNTPQGLWLHSYHQNMRTKRLSCIGCGKSFKSEKDTEEHELRCDLNHNEYHFNCMFCDEPFGTPKLLRNHELQHRSRRKSKNHKCVCIICRKPFDSIHSLKEHIRECHKSNVKAEYDEEVHTQPGQRSLNMGEIKSCYVLLKDIDQPRTKQGKPNARSCRTKRKTTGRVVSSAECDLGSAEPAEGENGSHSTPIMDVHIKMERDCSSGVEAPSGGVEECKFITREFPDDLIESPAYLVETELAKPEMTPEERQRSFQCGKCNSTFDSYGKLRYHSYSHRQRTKRLFCIGCGEGFEQSNDRDRHELECDVNITNGHFTCIFCELPFDTPQTLRNHENRHRPPKRYKRYKHMCLCAECDRAFDAVFTLKVHIRHMHRGNKEKIEIKEEVEEVNFESDLTFEEFKFDGDLKVERSH